MTHISDGNRAIGFGSGGLAFVRQELRTASTGFDGPLALRLADQELGFPFSFLAPDAVSVARDWESGGVDDGRSDRCLAIALSDWLRQPDPGRLRLVALEDSLARYTDPVVDPRMMHFGERVYHAARRGDGPDEVHSVFRRLPGYPGVGVVTRPLAGVVESCDLFEDALDAMALAAVAVLVRAWDDEAFLVAPVANRLTPNDLRC
jgi:hypothetical protein